MTKKETFCDVTVNVMRRDTTEIFREQPGICIMYNRLTVDVSVVFSSMAKCLISLKAIDNLMFSTFVTVTKLHVSRPRKDFNTPPPLIARL
jgi:hypothetical protein